MSLSFADGTGPLPDTWKELRFILVVLGLGAVAVFTGSMLYVQENPGAPWQLEAAYSTVFSFADETAITSETTLRLPQEDAAYLNRIFRELDSYAETGYCVSLVGAEMRVSKAATLEASESMVKFSTANCRMVDGTIHTHPVDSRPVLSGPETSVHDTFNDKQALLSSSHQLSCVQAGLITETPGAETEALQCYTRPESGEIDDEFPVVPVEVVEG